MKKNYTKHGKKSLKILDTIDTREGLGKSTSIYAIAKAMRYVPNGSFSDSIWRCVEKGWIDARPAGTRGGRFSWQLSVTTSGWLVLLNNGYRSLGYGAETYKPA